MENSEILKLAVLEKKRQEETLSLIASENSVYPEALEIASFPLSNKYCEGYPGKRFYAGCEYIDLIESEAIESTKKLFNCKYANVQSFSGSIANLSIYKALLKPGDTILSMDMSSGGHLTHSSKVSFVTHYYKVETYTVDKETLKLDYSSIRDIALSVKPKLIIAGASSYPFEICFESFRKIADEVGAYLLADICHLSGFVATGLHKHCFPHAHVAMCTTHKQLRGTRGALIFWNDEDLTERINKSVFPGTQGGMNPSTIAINTIAIKKSLSSDYFQYMSDVLMNARIMMNKLKELGAAVIGTQTHFFLVNTKKSFGLTGLEASKLLEKAGYITNPNLLPFDTESPFITSGVRIGTLFLTTLKPSIEEVEWLVNQIFKVLSSKKIEVALKAKEYLKNWRINRCIDSD
ncbi:serine hydroxymethyltransferase [Candidatus Mycoplasma haematohominis]|uniref:Serine hydroxymethyltransferase n=1 Tax=Candidatus Mycoplasma haematohominis TaxID=1494318 RepID=A0A478FRF2_9MOLU|nr:serine hydroxymethyltransferase [Candidatus Mycoplasma haemohominis]